MTGSSIQQFMLTDTVMVKSVSIAANQRCVIYANQSLRVAYDEGDLANSRNYFLVQFEPSGGASTSPPFIIEPEGAMTDQRVLWLRAHASATPVYVWLQGGGV